MAITPAVNGKGQTPSSTTDWQDLFTAEQAGFPIYGILIWSAVADAEVYIDGWGTDPAPIIAGAQPVQFLVSGNRPPIKAVKVRGAATAQVSWISNILG